MATVLHALTLYVLSGMATTALAMVSSPTMVLYISATVRCSIVTATIWTVLLWPTYIVGLVLGMASVLLYPGRK